MNYEFASLYLFTIFLLSFACILSLSDGHSSESHAVELPGNTRKFIVITDYEPDDIMALHLLAGNFEQHQIIAIGTTVMNAALKKQRVADLMAALGWKDVEVLQGTGGSEESYPDIEGLKAAKSFGKEESGDMEPNDDRTSGELCERIINELGQKDGIEFIVLSTPVDLVEALKRVPHLQAKVKRIHMMGGWMPRRGNDGKDVLFTTYNWNLNVKAVTELLAMKEVPISIYSSHVINPLFKAEGFKNGGSINRHTCRDVLDAIGKAKGMKSLEIFWEAVKKWDKHLIKTVPYLEERIGKVAEKQFTPADPTVIVALVKPDFVMETQKVKINIDEDSLGQYGYPVKWQVEESNHLLITKLNPNVFVDTFITTFENFKDKEVKVTHDTSA